MEQALANAGPAVMIKDTNCSIVIVEVVELADRKFTNSDPPEGFVLVKESLRGDVKLEKLKARWRPYPHGYDTPNPAGVKKWQEAAFEGPPVVGRTAILLGRVLDDGHFEVMVRGELPIEKREWVLKQLAHAKKTKP